VSSTSARLWWRGARPRTLGLGVVPVLVGVAAAGHVIAWRLIAALLVAAGLQIGVNFANDYFDGVRGVDTAERIGPPRLVASGAASPRAVLTASLLSLGLAGACGLALALATTPALVLGVGALALVAALLYSGGPRPYAGGGRMTSYPHIGPRYGPVLVPACCQRCRMTDASSHAETAATTSATMAQNAEARKVTKRARPSPSEAAGFSRPRARPTCLRR